ncbi:MAG: helix-turn-helix domain-containing protein [archaeon]
MRESYIVREENNQLYFSPAAIYSDVSHIKVISNDIRIEILKQLTKKPMYPAELAKKMGLPEQNVYYHIKALLKADILDIVEKKEIRGTVAKKFAPKYMNFGLSLSEEWNRMGNPDAPTNKKLSLLLQPFIADGIFTSVIVVGSPDPHGQFKARARDGHYATDLALFLGKYGGIPSLSSVCLDVNVIDKRQNMIVLGGPITNLLASEINCALPVKFSDKKPFGLTSDRTKKKYSDDNIGIVARILNPSDKSKYILYLAGVSNIGTKSAVIALTRNTGVLLQTFSNQKNWGAVVSGYDLDGDGEVDSVEILE